MGMWKRKQCRPGALPLYIYAAHSLLLKKNLKEYNLILVRIKSGSFKNALLYLIQLKNSLYFYHTTDIFKYSPSILLQIFFYW